MVIVGALTAVLNALLKSASLATMSRCVVEMEVMPEWLVGEKFVPASAIKS